MKKNPAKLVLAWVIVTGILFILGLINVINPSFAVPEFVSGNVIPFAILSFALVQLYLVCRHVQKRFDALEEKLNEQNQSKEQL